MSIRWSDCFTALTDRRIGFNATETIQADETIWEGWFEGHLLCIFATGRLANGNLAHLSVNASVRVEENACSLRAKHFVDFRVLSKYPLSMDELRRLGELARTEDQRPIALRQGREPLDQAITVPASS